MPSFHSAEPLRADAVIVGGGLAGLTTGVALTRAGLKVAVVERERRLGGRAQSWTDPVTGDPVHIGPHVLMSQYPNMFALLDLLGTREKLVWQDDHFITLVEGRREVVMKEADLPAPMQFIPSLIETGFGRRNLLSNVPATLYAIQMDEEDVSRLDGINASAFLRRLGVSQGAMDTFWSFTSMAIMNVPLELCSAGALMRLYQKLIGQRRYHFGFADGGLGDLFAPQARALIERGGGRVLLESAAERFTGTPGRVTGVRLSSGLELHAPTTIAALPPQALRRLAHREWLSRRPFSDLVHFYPSPYVSTFLWFDRKLTRRRMWARRESANDLNTDFYDLSNIHRGWEERSSVIASNAIYAHHALGLSDEQLVEQTVREISEYLPEARLERVRHSVVNRIPMAIHCPFPGTERRRAPTRSGVAGLLLAGDWIATALPSSMESACMAGWRAAEVVLGDLGRPAKLAREHDGPTDLTGLMHRAAQWMPTRSLRRLLRNGSRVSAEVARHPTAAVLP